VESEDDAAEEAEGEEGGESEERAGKKAKTAEGGTGEYDLLRCHEDMLTRRVAM
jgi:hypothetical protein